MARILYVSQGYCTHDQRFVERLVQEGHDMWLLPCEATAVQSDLTPFSGEVRWLEPLSKRPVSPGTSAWAAAAMRFREVARSVSPDLIHAGPIPIGGFFAALAGFHPLLMMSWGSDVLLFPDESLVARRITEFALQRADAVIVDCEAVRDRVAEFSGHRREQIVCLPWGVDLGSFRPKASSLSLRRRLGWSNSRVIVSARALESIHNPLVLLEALRRVLVHRSDVRLLMLGDGSRKDIVRLFVERHNLSQKVHLAGRVPEIAIPDYFAEADLYVCTTGCDGSSISLLQAMACGLPAVVVDGYGNKEWIIHGENGWLYPACDSEALARTILHALADDSAREVAGQMNIQITRARADWGKNFAEVLSAYDELLADADNHKAEDGAELQNR